MKPLDMFDKGYSHNTAFTFKMNSKPSYNVGFNYKGEFLTNSDELGFDWEYKFRHNRANGITSILCSNAKVEAEAELWGKPRKLGNIKGKLAFKPKTGKEKGDDLLKALDTNAEIEMKYHGIKHFYGSLKIAKAFGVPFPIAKLTGLYKLKPQGIIMGASCTLDRTVQQPYFEPLELLVGVMPNKNTLLYLKHSATNFLFPGQFTAGAYKAGAIEITWPKTKKDQVVNKVYQYKVETAAEASINMINPNAISARMGMKLLTKKAITFQTMFDSNLIWRSALNYRPSTKLNFALSNQLDFKKFKENPKKGFYRSGFTIELLC